MKAAKLAAAGGPGPERRSPRRRLTVVSGPSGVGKSSVVAELRRLRPEIYFSVSVTTRPPRPGEVEGVHYHFIDRTTFSKLVEAGELLEHAEFAGNCYGTPRESFLSLEQPIPSILRRIVRLTSSNSLAKNGMRCMRPQ